MPSHQEEIRQTASESIDDGRTTKRYVKQEIEKERKEKPIAIATIHNLQATIIIIYRQQKKTNRYS
jgi:hypothetical protein